MSDMFDEEANEKKEPETLTFTTEDFQKFMDQMSGLLTQTCSNAMEFVFNKTFPPLAERIELVAQAQLVLARALRTNRRDSNALEFSKLFLSKAIDSGNEIEPATIAANAYALATEMEVHAQVNDMQAESKQQNLEQHVEASPKVSTAALVDSFFGRDKGAKKGKKH